MGGLCKAVVIMLVESCALYAVNSLLIVGPLGVGNPVSSLFMTTLVQTQVRASDFETGCMANVATDWIGHCSAARHSTDCQ